MLKKQSKSFLLPTIALLCTCVLVASVPPASAMAKQAANANDLQRAKATVGGGKGEKLRILMSVQAFRLTATHFTFNARIARTLLEKASDVIESIVRFSQ